MFIVCVEAMALLQLCIIVFAPVLLYHMDVMAVKFLHILIINVKTSKCMLRYNSLHTFRILSLTVVVADSIWAVEPRVLPTRPDILTLVRADYESVCPLKIYI